jgi:hypothetical protein
MAHAYPIFLLLVLTSPFGCTQETARELSSQTGTGAKVCVAVVNNRTAKSMDPDRMTVRLVRAITDKKKLTAIAMESAAGDSKELRPTLENSEEMKRRECDYLVLTQVSDPKSNPTELRSPQITIGGKVPSTDASDPLGGQSGPVSRDNLEINFAVFRPGNPKAVLDTRILDRPSANVSDSLMQGMDREGSRVSKELGKK